MRKTRDVREIVHVDPLQKKDDGTKVPWSITAQLMRTLKLVQAPTPDKSVKCEKSAISNVLIMKG